MKTKILTTAVLLGIASLANAEPVSAPKIYDNGPASPLLNTTDMRVDEKAAFAMMEAMMQTTESYIYAKTGCPTLSVDVEVYSHSGSNTHFIEDKTYGGIRLEATPQPAVNGYGQAFNVNQPAAGVLNGTKVRRAKGMYLFNNKNNMMIKKIWRSSHRPKLGV
jgi:hypothetical protein